MLQGRTRKSQKKVRKEGKLSQREVELKVQTRAEEVPNLTQKVLDLGFVQGGPVRQEDIYLPTASADSTKRLRKESHGEKVRWFLTTKEPGPGEYGHSARVEVEAQITSERFEELQRECSDKTKLITVDKVRTPFIGTVQSSIGELELSIGFDWVNNLGPNGQPACFVELECLQPGDADQSRIEQVLKELRSFAEELIGAGIIPEARSYKKLAAQAAAAAAKTASNPYIPFLPESKS